MTRAARRLFDRSQHATVLGPMRVVLSRAVGGVFPARPELVADGGRQDRGAVDRADVQRDMLLLAIKKASESQKHEDLLDYVAELKAVTDELPSEAKYYQGIAYVLLERYEDGIEVLTEYLEQVGREGEHYHELLEGLLELKQWLAADDEAYEQTKKAGTAAAYGDYLSGYERGQHSGKHVDEARRIQEELSAREDDKRIRACGEFRNRGRIRGVLGDISEGAPRSGSTAPASAGGSGSRVGTAEPWHEISRL